MASKRYAATGKLEWPGRVVQPGEIVDAGDFPEDGSIEALLEGGSIEPYDEKEHGDGWYEQRQAAANDAEFKKAGVQRISAGVTPDIDGNGVVAGDAASGRDRK